MISLEPKVHSHLDDGLPDDHPLASKCVHCQKCGVMVHSPNNECMQTWYEMANGDAYCTRCLRLGQVLEGWPFQGSAISRWENNIGIFEPTTTNYPRKT